MANLIFGAVLMVVSCIFFTNAVLPFPEGTDPSPLNRSLMRLMFGAIAVLTFMIAYSLFSI